MGNSSSAAAPLTTAEYAHDIAAMAADLHQLAALPVKGSRNEADQELADGLLQRCSATRRRVLAEHASAIYSDLTDSCRLSLRLDELVAAAAAHYPGLLPDSELVKAERGHPQAKRDGHERDLGLFFWSVLRSPQAGRHLLQSMLRPTSRALALLPEFRDRGFADLEVVTVERRDGIGHVTLNNLAYLNAEDDDVVEALETAVDLVLLDNGSGVGVLRGGVMTKDGYHGRRVFNAGINLTRLYHGEISLLGFLLRRELGYVNKIACGLVSADADPADPVPIEKPWLGAVDTFAIGGGTQLLLVLDRVVAERGSYFVMPAAQEGLIPGAANLRMTRAVGTRAARRLLLWGEPVRATDPDAALICDEVVATDEIGNAITAAADRLGQPAVIANRRMLRLAEEPADAFREYMANYALYQAQRLHSADLAENLARAWIQRRRRPHPQEHR